MRMDAKALVSMPEQFLKQVDSFAKRQHMTRAELVRQALREYKAKLELERERALHV